MNVLTFLPGLIYLHQVDSFTTIPWTDLCPVAGYLVSFCYFCFKEIPVFSAKCVDPDQMLCSAGSDLGLHCLPFTLLGVSRLKLVNTPSCPPFNMCSVKESGLFMPGSSSAYLFEVVFVKCVCIWRTLVFFQFYGVLSGVIYNYSSPTFFSFFLCILKSNGL